MTKIYSLLLLLPLIFSGKVNAQTASSDLQASIEAGIDPYFIETTDTISKSGPWHITRDLLQDKDGNFWFATWHGIIKYDGKIFTNYTLKEGLIHFHVVSIYEDKKGNVWFGTARGGLYCYSNGSFTLYKIKDGLPDNTVSCMVEDKKGNMWFGTEKGISCYDGKIFTNFTTKDGLSGNKISSIIEDKKGKIWFGSMDGISCYENKTFSEFKNEKGLPIKKVTSLLADKAGNIWIGRFDGLARYDGRSFTEYLSEFLTYYMIEDQAGNIWLTHAETNTHYLNCPNQVLYKYDGKSFLKIIEKYDQNDCQIFGKIIDKTGNLWFGTMHGVCRFDLGRVDHPCVKKTCKHDHLEMREAIKEHDAEIARSYNYFKK